MKPLIIVIVLIILFTALLTLNELPQDKLSISQVTQIVIEAAYMQGQIDALNGDIRIKEIDSDYKWEGSIWDSDEKENTYIYWSQYMEKFNEILGEKK